MKLRGFLINPWKHQLTEVEVDRSLEAWYKLLHCDSIDVCHVGKCAGLSVDVFVDDSGLLQEPRAPFFKLAGSHSALCGYGLVLASDGCGETVSLPECLTPEVFAQVQSLRMEQWERRIDPRDVDPEHII